VEAVLSSKAGGSPGRCAHVVERGVYGSREMPGKWRITGGYAVGRREATLDE
jgi:hypothetical protein